MDRAQKESGDMSAEPSLSSEHHPATEPQWWQGDARRICDIKEIGSNSVDLVVTSPPYWQRRDYGHDDQLGQESTPEAYAKALIDTVDGWKEVLRSHASVFLNVGDTYRDGFLVGVPALVQVEARRRGWETANWVVWAKDYGMPEPHPSRLARRHETVLQLVRSKDYYFDLHALKDHLGQTSNPGNVWRLHHARNKNGHTAPFPPDLARYAILVAGPTYVCQRCKKPYERQLTHTATNLDESRPQARRALEIYRDSELTKEHLAAIRAVGISDAGKGKRLQNGAGQNAERVQELAREAKEVLGGYFREFTFAAKQHDGWMPGCTCDAPTEAGTVLDPFMGSGTTLRVAQELRRNALGVDLDPPDTIE